MELNRTKILQALTVLIVFIVISVLITMNKPQGTQRKSAIKSALSVEVTKIIPLDHQFILNSFGNVQPKTQSLLVSQISGQVTQVMPAFHEGGFFNKGDLLVQIDDRDYVATANIAKAELMQARLALAEETARANQALIDWERLGNGELAPDLVLRKPQLAVAQANILSAQANFDKAQLNLTRTKVTAPYDGRIKNKFVDLGQFVSSNTQLAEIFSTDVLEVRLPLNNSDLPFIQLPENFKNLVLDTQSLPSVTISSDLGQHQEWQGKIVRTEAAIDPNSHQLYVVAQIDQPFIKGEKHTSPLKIGQYITAEIQGTKLEDIIVIPNSSIYQGSYVYTVKNNLLQRQNITIGFQSSDLAFITSGLNSNDQLVTSPLGQVTSGTKVAIKKITPSTNIDDKSLEESQP